MHMVSDTVGGLNLRLTDNLVQAAVIAAATVLGALVGWMVGPAGGTGLVLGAGAGLLVGFFGSGFVIGLYGLVRRVSGRAG